MKKHKILIVEDEHVIALDTKNILQMADYSVAGIISSGDEVVKKIKELQPDIVLMDINIKGSINGMQAAEQIHDFCDIPVIYITAYADKKTLNRAKLTEPYGYIIKPFKEKELLSVIEMAIYKHKMDKKIRENEQRLSIILKSMGEAVFVTDNKGIVTFMNPAAEDLINILQEEAKGKPLEEVLNIVSQRTSRNTINLIIDVLKTKVTIDLIDDALLIIKDGTEIPIGGRTAPILNNKGDIEGLIVVFSDMTIYKQLQQAQKSEAVGLLAGGIAHDFNNILGIILGYTEIAISDIENSRDNLIRLKEVLTAAQRAKGIVNQILTFSSKKEISYIPIKMSSRIKESLRLIRAVIPANIEIITYLKAETSMVLIDPVQIDQIMLNLCTNAAQAMQGKGGVLKVSLVEEKIDANQAISNVNLFPGSYLKLTISDTGSGMESSVKEHIFDPYFTTRDKTGGTGLGLSVAYSSITDIGGAISVKSEKGIGSVFDVYFPLMAERCPIHINKAKEIQKGTGRILFIDDEEMLGRIGKEMLGNAGYQVDTQTSSIDALELFRVQPDNYDLVITDQTMPYMTGIELSGEMLRIRPEIPIILCSGYAEETIVEQAESMGIREILMKPVLSSKMSAAIKNALSQ